jgi:hypothetical protein
MQELDWLLQLLASVLLPTLIGLLVLLLIWAVLLLGWHPKGRVVGSVNQVRNSLSEYFHRNGKEFRHDGDDLLVRLDSLAAVQFRFIGDGDAVTVICRAREGEAWWWFGVLLPFGCIVSFIMVGAALYTAVRAKRKAAAFIRSITLQPSSA